MTAVAASSLTRVDCPDGVADGVALCCYHTLIHIHPPTQQSVLEQLNLPAISWLQVDSCQQLVPPRGKIFPNLDGQEDAAHVLRRLLVVIDVENRTNPLKGKGGLRCGRNAVVGLVLLECTARFILSLLASKTSLF